MREYIFTVYESPASIADPSPVCAVVYSGRFQATVEDMYALTGFYCITRSSSAKLAMVIHEPPPLTREQGGVVAEELNQPLIVDHAVE